MLKVVAFCLVVTAAFATEKRTLLTLDPGNLKNVDAMFRGYISNALKKYDPTLASEAKSLNIETLTCDAKLNTSMKLCTDCTSSKCQPGPAQEVSTESQNLFHQVGAVIKYASHKVENEVKNAVKEIGHAASHVYHQVVDHVVDQVKHTIVDPVKTVSHIAVDPVLHSVHEVGHAVEHVAHSVGHAVEHLGHSIHHAISHVFGRKRALQFSAEATACMDKCSDCSSLLMGEDAWVRAVCGDSYVLLNHTVQHKIAQMRELLKALNETIISKVEYTGVSATNPLDVQMVNVQITANVHGRNIAYQSQFPFHLLDLNTTAREFAQEYLSTNYNFLHL